VEIVDVEGLFDAPIVVLSAPVSEDAVPGLRPEEAARVAKAMPKRVREYATGRALAHAALARLGASSPAILNDDQRAPIWPDGVRGSITHCDTRAIVAVCRSEHGSVGIDVEHRAELGRHLWESVFLAREIDALDALPEAERGRMALVLFSAKEALYKAQFPISRTYMGFRALHVAAEAGGLVCTWQHDVPPFAIGAVAHGRYQLGAPPTGEVLTGVHLPAR
jgi:4'-phosphopantetheinyl transferase EntD